MENDIGWGWRSNSTALLSQAASVDQSRRFLVQTYVDQGLTSQENGCTITLMLNHFN